MQYQQTPQGLSQMFDANVSNGGGSIAATPAMMGLWAQQQNADNMVGQDQARQLSYDTAADPFKLQKLNLDNQTSEAHLPGILAQSSMLKRADSNEATTNDAKIKDILGKYKSADIKRHVDDTSAFGDRLAQMGEEAFSNPVGAAARVKAELESTGHGDLWNPSWETSSPGLLARQLSDYGSDIQKTSSKFKQQLELANTKADSARDVAGINADAKTDVQAMKNAMAAKVAELKKAAGSSPKNLEGLATKLENDALNEPDAATKAELLQHSLRIRQEAATLKAAGAQVVTDAKPAVGPLGFKTNKDVREGTSAVPAGFPEGTKVGPDGTLTLPDGRVVRKKQ